MKFVKIFVHTIFILFSIYAFSHTVLQQDVNSPLFKFFICLACVLSIVFLLYSMYYEVKFPIK